MATTNEQIFSLAELATLEALCREDADRLEDDGDEDDLPPAFRQRASAVRTMRALADKCRDLRQPKPPRLCDEPGCLRHDEHYHIAPDMRECGNVP